MDDDVTYPLLIQINDEERAALKRFMAAHPRKYSEAQAARLLLRDQLVAMGDLALPRANRGRAAGNKKPAAR